MRKVKIITDTCSDLSPELMAHYDIDYAKMSLVEDGVESPARLDWSKAENHAFFEKMRGGKRITTSQVPVAEFERIFRLYLEQGCDIVYVACSSKQSSSVNTGGVVAKRILADYPDADIFCIDSLNASAGEGMLAIEAAKLAQDGMSAAEITDCILAIRKNVNQYITVHTLDYLKRSGRVSASSAFFGNLMGIKPILISDANGVQVAVKKVKGRQNALKELAALTKANIRDAQQQTLYLVQSDALPDDIALLKSELSQAVDCKEICVLDLGPIIGASIGPDAIGVFSFGEPVTFVGGEE